MSWDLICRKITRHATGSHNLSIAACCSVRASCQPWSKLIALCHGGNTLFHARIECTFVRASRELNALFTTVGQTLIPNPPDTKSSTQSLPHHCLATPYAQRVQHALTFWGCMRSACRASLHLLLTILSNILKNPDDDKYRRIKLANPSVTQHTLFFLPHTCSFFSLTESRGGFVASAYTTHRCAQHQHLSSVQTLFMVWVSSRTPTIIITPVTDT